MHFQTFTDMIPKIIHYCWLSNDPIPVQLQTCMDTWKRMLPDYEWMLWNFDRFPKSQSKWVSDAYDNKKYAFAADYIRLYALYNYGGFYLDMDVRVLKSFEPLLSLPHALSWQCDADSGLEVAAMGSERGAPWLKDCLDYFDQRQFIKPNGSLNTVVLPWVVLTVLQHKGYQIQNIDSIEQCAEVAKQPKVIAVLPSDFFSPKSYRTGELKTTSNTYSIHDFAGSWISVKDKQWHEDKLAEKKTAPKEKKSIPISFRIKIVISDILKVLGIQKRLWYFLHRNEPFKHPEDIKTHEDRIRQRYYEYLGKWG